MEEKLNLDHHISRKFNDELETLRARVLTMGGLVEQQCTSAVQALVSGDARLADTVANADHEVNELEIQINAQCLDILARRQPAASDLRMILSVIRMISDLERIGDEAQKIGRLVLKLLQSAHAPSNYNEPELLGKSVVEMLRCGLDAFARLDVDAAINTAARDEDINQEFDALTRHMLDRIMEEPQQVKNLLRVNWCARALERIGDHTVNLCEEVIFLVKGSDVRHLSLEEIRAKFA